MNSNLKNRTPLKLEINLAMTYVNKIPELMQAHPRLFKNKDTRCQSDLGKGWYELVDTLCKQIDALMDDEEIAAFEIRQIKEKFGGLRFYFKASEKMRPRIKELIDVAYQKSLICCDECGAYRLPNSSPTLNLYCASCIGNKYQECL
jgi:hypothetical protein